MTGVMFESCKTKHPAANGQRDVEILNIQEKGQWVLIK